jgi:hypothetical protein
MDGMGCEKRHEFPAAELVLLLEPVSSLIEAAVVVDIVAKQET